MDGAHDRGITPQMQAQMAPAYQGELYQVAQPGKGELPLTGCYNAKGWAWFTGKDEKTIWAWIKKYDIAHIQPGSDIYIYAEDFHAAFKPRRPSEIAKQRGGNRRRPKAKG